MASTSILLDVKKFLGDTFDGDDSFFDTSLLMAINMAVSEIAQNGGCRDNFSVEDETTTWDEMSDNVMLINFAKVYICNQVKLEFDTPQNSTLKDQYANKAAEALWRINIMVNPKENNVYG